jgi:putative transposase
MESLNEIINASKDAREVKRALSVKMVLHEVPTSQISALLNVSAQYISKWRLRYEAAGAQALLLGYQGSASYLSGEQREAIYAWIQSHESITVGAVRDYIEEEYDVLYQSKQSYYDLLQEAGLSYHKSEPRNPQRDEAFVVARRAQIKKNWSSTKPR